MERYGSSEHYLGKAGQIYFAWQSAHGDIHGTINARVFQQHIKTNDCVLDFGCGGGYMLKSLACAERLGVELNPVAREQANRSGVECYADLSELPDAKADVVISNHALEHVPYPVRALAEMRRVMKPGGLLVLKLPIDDWRTQRHIDATDINHHLYTWTPQLLFNCLDEARFSKQRIDIRVYTHAWFPGAEKAFQLLPEFVFDAGCTLFAMYTRRRQLVAVARND